MPFRVEERKLSYKDLQFEVPPGTSAEETAAALKKALHDPYCWAMPGDELCGATLVDFEDGLFEEVLGGPPVIEVLDVIQTDADGEDLEGEAGLPTRQDAAERLIELIVLALERSRCRAAEGLAALAEALDGEPISQSDPSLLVDADHLMALARFSTGKA